MKSLWIRRAVGIAAVVAVAVALRVTVFRADPVPVTVFRAAPGRVEATVTNSKAGTVKSRRRASLSPESGGRVESVPVREGDRVRAGQLLLRLSPEDARAQLAFQDRSVEAARAGETEACRRADQAARDLARTAELARQEIVSAQILEQFQSARDVASAACEAARARVRQALAALDLARVALAKTDLLAPFDGVVADVQTEVGEWITPSPPGLRIPPVIELIDPSAIYVGAPMDEVDAGKIREGQPARISLDAFPDRSFPGRVTRVAPYVLDVVEQNRTFDVEAEFEDSGLARQLLPGTSVDIEVILAAKEGALRVPTSALLEGSRVLVVRGSTLVGVEVATGLRNWEFAEILRGLAEGDLVVSSLDRAEVREGAKVRVSGETFR